MGQTRSSTLIPRLTAFGFGEMVARGEYPPRRTPWAYDNGAFGDWKAQRPFDADRFRREIERIADADHQPDFLVVPDIVAGGWKSLEFSLAWLDELTGVAPLYLAVQDGMHTDGIADVVDQFAGLFVGGSLPWKVRHGEMWCSFARDLGLSSHIGRAGTFKRVRWAQRIGADGIDSCLPLWSENNLQRFLGALAEDSQLALHPRAAEGTP